MVSQVSVRTHKYGKRTQCVVLFGLVAPVDHLDDPLAQDLHAACSPANQITLTQSIWFKVIRKFFLNHNKSFRWHLGDYEKHIFFSI